MSEEVKDTISESQQDQVVSNNDYIEAIKEMRKTTVAKSDYDALKEENRKLLNSLINGETIDGAETGETVTIEELRKELYSTETQMTNLEYAQKTLQLRDMILANGGKDPFLPAGHGYAAEPADIEAANRVAKVIKDCIDYADGDSEIFTNELQRVMVDTAPLARRR